MTSGPFTLGKEAGGDGSPAISLTLWRTQEEMVPGRGNGTVKTWCFRAHHPVPVKVQMPAPTPE